MARHHRQLTTPIHYGERMPGGATEVKNWDVKIGVRNGMWYAQIGPSIYESDSREGIAKKIAYSDQTFQKGYTLHPGQIMVSRQGKRVPMNGVVEAQAFDIEAINRHLGTILDERRPAKQQASTSSYGYQPFQPEPRPESRQESLPSWARPVRDEDGLSYEEKLLRRLFGE